jgi:hypothetical protein
MDPLLVAISFPCFQDDAITMPLMKLASPSGFELAMLLELIDRGARIDGMDLLTFALTRRKLCIVLLLIDGGYYSAKEVKVIMEQSFVQLKVDRQFAASVRTFLMVSDVAKSDPWIRYVHSVDSASQSLSDSLTSSM